MDMNYLYDTYEKGNMSIPLLFESQAYSKYYSDAIRYTLVRQSTCEISKSKHN